MNNHGRYWVLSTRILAATLSITSYNIDWFANRLYMVITADLHGMQAVPYGIFATGFFELADTLQSSEE